MKVYVDNNVLIDYEENKIILPDREEILYYFSHVHIDEMMELGDKLDEKRNKRLVAIRALSKGKYLSNNDDNEVSVFYEDPFSVLSYCMTPIYKITLDCLKQLQSQFAIKEKREIIIKNLNINVRRLNNYSAKEIVKEFGADLYTYVNYSSENIQTAFQSLFNFLDMIGFWADKYTERSNMARLYDANHAYYATYCDYFVTDDSRTMNKANVAYQWLGFNTVAVSCKDFLSNVVY